MCIGPGIKVTQVEVGYDDYLQAKDRILVPCLSEWE